MIDYNTLTVLDEKLTAEEYLDRLKTELERIGLQMQTQAYRERGIKLGVDQCIQMCDIVKKKFADEKKLLGDHIKQLH